jgi:hypothetical protein
VACPSLFEARHTGGRKGICYLCDGSKGRRTIRQTGKTGPFDRTRVVEAGDIAEKGGDGQGVGAGEAVVAHFENMPKKQGQLPKQKTESKPGQIGRE